MFWRVQMTMMVYHPGGWLEAMNWKTDSDHGMDIYFQRRVLVSEIKQKELRVCSNLFQKAQFSSKIPPYSFVLVHYTATICKSIISYPLENHRMKNCQIGCLCYSLYDSKYSPLREYFSINAHWGEVDHFSLRYLNLSVLIEQVSPAEGWASYPDFSRHYPEQYELLLRCFHLQLPLAHHSCSLLRRVSS